MRSTQMRSTKYLLSIGAAAALLGLAAGCGGSSGAGPAAPARPAAASPTPGRLIVPASLKPGQAVPAAPKPVLTLTGKISNHNKGGTLALDQRTLARLGVVQVRLYEPWAKKDLEFRGVWLQDLLAVAGASPAATKVHMTALDDYVVDLTMADVRAGGIMLAITDGDGAALPIDKGGPTRIVFMDGVKAGANADQWIWSLKTIAVQ
jgi:hypothetical protein